MAILEPLSERDPEAWAVRFLAHVTVGLLAWHSCIWTVGPFHAAWAVPLAYLLVWEVLVQRVGAGWWDAVADTLAVALGAGLGLETMHPNPAAFAALLVAVVGAASYGAWRRL